MSEQLFADVNGARIHYRIDGEASERTVVLSNPLGANFSLWEPQMAALGRKFRVVRYDGRGHGESSVTSGDYSTELLGQDVLALLDHVGIGTACFCGLSLGGMVGMWLGVNAPGRVEKLALCSTAARIGTAESWNTRIATVRKGGMAAITENILERWFTPEFAQRAPGAVQRVREMLLRTSPEGYAANCAAVRDADFREALASVRAQTLVISGTHDPATPPADGRFLAERIPRAKFVTLQAAHITNIEAAREFTEEVTRFLEA